MLVQCVGGGAGTNKLAVTTVQRFNPTNRALAQQPHTNRKLKG